MEENVSKDQGVLGLWSSQHHGDEVTTKMVLKPDTRWSLSGFWLRLSETLSMSIWLCSLYPALPPQPVQKASGIRFSRSGKPTTDTCAADSRIPFLWGFPFPSYKIWWSHRRQPGSYDLTCAYRYVNKQLLCLRRQCTWCLTDHDCYWSPTWGLGILAPDY